MKPKLQTPSKTVKTGPKTSSQSLNPSSSDADFNFDDESVDSLESLESLESSCFEEDYEFFSDPENDSGTILSDNSSEVVSPSRSCPETPRTTNNGTFQKIKKMDKNTRTKQRHFLTNKLKSLKDMSPKLYSEIMVEPALQYFLALLCDWTVKDENKRRLGVRYAKTPEVQKLITKLHKSKFMGREMKNMDPNAVVSVLKEVLDEFPGGIFADSNEEFLCISLKSPQDIAMIYANGLIETLPIFLRQFTYLVCKSLRNLARQSSGSLIDSYTDLLMLFTPVLFPNVVGDVSRFLRAIRISLILIDLCDTVFKPFLTLRMDSNTDSAYHSDEDFFRDIVDSLTSLQDEFESSSEERDDSDAGQTDEADSRLESKMSKSNETYYQITYVE